MKSISSHKFLVWLIIWLIFSNFSFIFLCFEIFWTNSSSFGTIWCLTFIHKWFHVNSIWFNATSIFIPCKIYDFSHFCSYFVYFGSFWGIIGGFWSTTRLLGIDTCSTIYFETNLIDCKRSASLNVVKIINLFYFPIFDHFCSIWCVFKYLWITKGFYGPKVI
jgi:hypothetical protein